MRRLSLLFAVLAAMAALSSPGSGAPRASAISAFFIVNDPGDAPDSDSGDGLCKTAANVCTLRAAIEQANANGNPADTDTITFTNAPTGPGTVVNIRPLTPLPVITESVTITGLINTSGASCDAPRVLLVSIEPGAAMPGGIGLKAVNTTLVSIVGVQIGGFQQAGVMFEGGTANVVYCSNIGTDLAGTTARPNGVGVVVSGSDQTQVGFATAALSNIISGNTVGVSIDGSNATTVQGSYVGLAADGSTSLPNTSHGIRVRNSTLTNIGKDSANGGNVISSNGGNGVLLEADAGSLTSVFVEHNLIGYALDGTTLRPNGANGINIVADNVGTISSVRIGDFGVNDGNKIYADGSFSAVVAREVDEASTISGVRPRGSSLISESGLGFNLRPFDEAASIVTPNDENDLDADEGPNTLLNMPVLTSATSEDSPEIQFTYRSSADLVLSINFYAVSSCSGSPDQRSIDRLLGSAARQTDELGFVNSNSAVVSQPLAVGEGVVALAQDEAGNTSEISNCVTATLPPPVLSAPNPQFAVAGQSGFTLEIASFGGPFAPDAVITWDGQDLATTFIDDHHLSALVSAPLVGDTARTVLVGATGATAVEFSVVRSSSDLDCSGTVDATDALLLLNYLAGLDAGSSMSTCDLPPFPIGDADQDEATNLADVLHIRRELVDLAEPLAGEVIDD